MFVSNIQNTPLSPELDNLQLGDKLVSVNGMSLRLYYHVLIRGSESVLFSQLLDVNGRNKVLPQVQGVYLHFRTLGDQFYDVILPWLYDVDEECVRQVDEAFASMNDTNPNSLGLLRRSVGSRNLHPKVNLNLTIDQVHHFENHGDNVEWSIYEPETINMGVITIKTFGNATNAHQIATKIRQILTNQLSNTSAVVFDVRSVSGGMPSAVDLIPQFFKNNVVTGGSKIRAHPTNNHLVMHANHVNMTKWQIALVQSNPNVDIYTPLVKYLEDQDANRLGPVYYKPVGVFKDQNCVDACELFAAVMKDNNIATIFGVSQVPAKAASNYFDYNSFLNAENPTTYPSLPLTDRLPSFAAPNFRFAWQKFVRPNGNAIEPEGVARDVIVDPSMNDIVNPTIISSQFYRIAQNLLPQLNLTSQIQPPPTQTPRMHLHFIPHSDTEDDSWNGTEVDSWSDDESEDNWLPSMTTTTRAPYPESTVLPNRIFKEEDEECITCQARLKDTIISPCGHFCSCNDCCQNFDRCPMCRQLIECLIPGNLAD